MQNSGGATASNAPEPEQPTALRSAPFSKERALYHIKTLQELFKRYRKPGDIVFATFFCLFCFLLISQFGDQIKWVKRAKLYAQPGFWPAISLGFMTLFGMLHFIGSLCSPRIHGRWQEVWFWVKSLEFVAYFLIYVAAVPQLGYMPSTILFSIFLSFRVGYRSVRAALMSAIFGVSVALIFRAFLQVKIPAGAIYEWLPDGLRAFALTYL